MATDHPNAGPSPEADDAEDIDAMFGDDDELSLDARDDQPDAGAAPRPADGDDVDDDDEADLDTADDLAAAGASPVLVHSFLIRRDPKMRLDSYLQQRLKAISRSRVARLIDKADVLVNDKPSKRSYIVQTGDTIRVSLPKPAVRTIEPEAIPLDVLYEDEHLIVINKQADLIIHPARGNASGTLVNALAHRFKQEVESRGGQWATWTTSGLGGADLTSKQRREGLVKGLSSVGAEELRPGIVHRLDKHTTGCIVVAKSDFAHWRLAKQFQKRQTVKSYLAIVHGRFDVPGMVIDQPIGKHPTMREAYAVRHDHYGKESVTVMRVREVYRGYSLVELDLRTGRTHQIRVHLSYLGRPIVGDLVYGGEAIGWKELDEPPIPSSHRMYVTFARSREDGEKLAAAAASREDLIIAVPALHAAYLQFTHPATEKLMRFTAPLHSPMRDLLAELRTRPGDGPVAESGCMADVDQLLA